MRALPRFVSNMAYASSGPLIATSTASPAYASSIRSCSAQAHVIRVPIAIVKSRFGFAYPRARNPHFPSVNARHPIVTVPTPLYSRKTPTRSIILLAVAGFASQAQVRVTDSLLPQIAADFGTTVGAAAMVVTAYAV